jgi:hypothetical protein
MLEVVDAIGNGPPNGFAWEVMNIHRLGLLTPDPSGILEVAYQFFLFGIHTNTRLSSLLMRFALLLDVSKLTRSLRGVWSFGLFTIGSQAVILCLEQPTDDRKAQRMALLH